MIVVTRIVKSSLIGIACLAFSSPAFAQSCTTATVAVGPSGNTKTSCQTPAQATTEQINDPYGGYSSQDGRFYLAVQPDGNVVLHQYNSDSSDIVLWTSNKYYGIARETFYLNFQSDGNLVAYHSPNGTPAAWWSSGTGGNPGSTLYVQNDGNVVIRNVAARVIWTTRTCCH